MSVTLCCSRNLLHAFIYCQLHAFSGRGVKSFNCRNRHDQQLYSEQAEDAWFAGLTENAGRENDGPKMTAGREIAGEKVQL